MPSSIINGDALETIKAMPAGSIDALLSDPPYCSGGFTETQKKQAKGQGLRSETLRDLGWFEGDQMTSGGLAELLRSITFHTIPLLKNGGSLLYFTDWRMLPILVPAIESAGVRYQNLIVWNKPNAGLGRGFRAKHEIIMHFTAGKAEYHDASVGNVINSRRIGGEKRQHHTQKPVPLLQELIKVICPPGGTLLDPFGGSGSTAIAAESIGRHAICIERDPEHCKTAQQRLGEVQQSLFSTTEQNDA
jgi:DNA modification methylase